MPIVQNEPRIELLASGSHENFYRDLKRLEETCAAHYP